MNLTTLVDIRSSAEPAASGSSSEGSMVLIGIGAGITLMVLRGVVKAIRWAAPRLWVRWQRGGGDGGPGPDQGQNRTMPCMQSVWTTTQGGGCNLVGPHPTGVGQVAWAAPQG